MFKRLFITVCAAAACLATVPVLAQSTVVRMSVGGKSSVNYLPLTAAERLGYFKDQGLRVEISDFASGAKALQSLIGGSSDITMGYYDHVVQMRAKGQNIKAVIQTGRFPGLVLAVKKSLAGSYKSVADLKGMKVGVIGPGSSTHFMLNHMMLQAKMPLDSIPVIAVGVGPSVVAAVRQGGVDAIVNVEPVTTLLERSGDVVAVADTRTEEGTRQVYGGLYPAAVLYSRDEYVEKNPEVVQKIVTATVRALQWLSKATPEQVVDLMPPEYSLGDRDTYLAVIRKSMQLYSKDGMMNPTDLDTAVRVLHEVDPVVKGAGPTNMAATYDNRFVQRALQAR